MLRPFVVVGVACTLLAGCASTSLRDSWKHPGTTSPVSFDRVVVVFMSADESVRRIAEDALVRLANEGQAVASYTIVSQEEAQDTAGAADKIRAANFDGAIVMRVVGRNHHLYYSPGMGFYMHYSYGWPTVYQPGYLQSDTVLTVETNVYSVTEDKMLWSGISETFNPNDVAKAVTDVADAASRELRRQGLL